MCIVHLLSPMCGAAVYNVLLNHTKETLNVMFCFSMSAKLRMLTILHLTLILQSLLLQELMCMCAHDGIKVVFPFTFSVLTSVLSAI